MRSKPTILAENLNHETMMAEQILESEGLYAVFYKGEPINMRTISKISEDHPIKYTRTSFSNPGHAFNLAKKLNAQFSTTDFQVFVMQPLELVVK